MKQYLKTGYIDLLSGFRCNDIMNKKQVGNTPIQGSAFHCLLWSFIEINRMSMEESWKSRLLNQIHDSIVMEIHPSEMKYVCETVLKVTCKDLPQYWTWINVPLDVEIEACEVDESWALIKPFSMNEMR